MDGWTIFLLGLILGVPLNIFANLVTPWVKSYIKNRSLSSRQRRVVTIVTRYEKVAEYREDLSKLISSLVSDLIQMVSAVVVFLVLSHFDLEDMDLVIKFLGIMILFFVSVTSNAAERLFRDVREPNRYKESVIKELSKLGYTLEEAQELMNKQVSSK